MTLSNKYDQFYAADGNAAAGDMPEYSVRRWPRNRTEAVLSVPGIGSSVLDVGCGDGTLLYQFRNRFEHLIGLEYSSDRLAQASRKLGKLRFQALLGSAEAIPLAEGSVDRVICSDVIEHVPDVYAATLEMYRVLKPGALLVINTPNVAFIKKRLALALGRFPSTSQPNEGLGSDLLFDGGHLHYFTFRSLGLVLERAGFTLESRKGYGQWGVLQSFRPPLLSGGVQWVARKLT